MLRVYLAGPMRGIPLFNFPAFDAAERALQTSGYTVSSPARLDRQAGFDPTSLPENWDWNRLPSGLSLDDCILRDVEAIIGTHELCLLPGWQKSKGATAEKAVAEWAGHPVWEYDHKPENILQEADRITAGDRQAQYGPPNQDFKRTADMWTALFQHMLLPCEKFQPQHVAQAMILLKLSRQLHQQKRDNWVDIAGYAKCGQQCNEIPSTA